MNMKKITLLSIVLLALFATNGFAQQARYAKVCVAFYNQENLFDTIDGPNNDADFLPDGLNLWNSKRYQHKLHQMASVIAQIGNHGPDVIGLCEVENRGVLEDLIRQPELAKLNYSIAHFDSPDRRGIDCALLYRADIFQMTDCAPHFVSIPGEPEILTRDILQVSGIMAGESVHFLVGHWPSRSGGEEISLKRRMAAARVMRGVSDSIMTADSKAKVILMGDFNDDPTSPSVTKGLQAQEKTQGLQPADLFCPMTTMYKNGYGTLAYRDTWNLFDIMVVNGNLMNGSENEWTVLKNSKDGFYAQIFNERFLLQKYGQYKGYPLRTFAGGKYDGGYSDHLPVYLYLVKKF